MLIGKLQIFEAILEAYRDTPYPELKKTHPMAHVGRPFTDYKPPAAAPVWAVIEVLGRYHVLRAPSHTDTQSSECSSRPLSASPRKST